MDFSEIQNANPTIAAQLPSRRARKSAPSSRGPECKYDDILSGKHSAAPWDPDLNVSSWPSDSDHDDDGLTEEPIDEQEIYGQSFSFGKELPLYTAPCSLSNVTAAPICH